MIGMLYGAETVVDFMHASNDLQENHKMPGIKVCAN